MADRDFIIKKTISDHPSKMAYHEISRTYIPIIISINKYYFFYILLKCSLILDAFNICKKFRLFHLIDK